MTRPRFRLRSLIFAIVLIALVLGVLAHLRDDAKRYRQLAAAQQLARAEMMRAEAARMLAEAALAKERDLRRQAEAQGNGSASSR